jgi:hypothetical protein
MCVPNRGYVPWTSNVGHLLCLLFNERLGRGATLGLHEVTLVPSLPIRSLHGVKCCYVTSSLVGSHFLAVFESSWTFNFTVSLRYSKTQKRMGDFGLFQIFCRLVVMT